MEASMVGSPDSALPQLPALGQSRETEGPTFVIGKPLKPALQELPLAPKAASTQEGLHLRQHMFRAATVFFCVLTGFVNGYDICIFAIILPSLQETFGLCAGELTCFQKDLVMTVAAAGSLLAKLTLGWFADKYGRRSALLLVDLLLLSAGVLMATAASTGSFAQFVCGRSVLGVALGLAFVVEPSYLAEIAPRHLRGKFVVMNEVAVCSGCLLALWLGAWWIHTWQGSWAALCWFSVAPATLQLLWLLVLPESPRWLSLHGSEAEFTSACSKLGLPQDEVDIMRQQRRHSSSGSKSRADREGFCLALTFSIFTAGGGAYGFMAYAADFFEVNGVKHMETLLPLLGWAKLLGAIASMIFADRLGRRRLSSLGAAGCAVSCCVLAVRWASLSWEVPAAFLLMIFSWNIGFGGLQLVVVSEMVPNHVRARWAGLIYGATDAITVITYATYDKLLVQAPQPMMAFFAVVNTVAAFFAMACMPERCGEALEATHSIDGNPCGTLDTLGPGWSARAMPVGVASRFQGNFQGHYAVLDVSEELADFQPSNNSRTGVNRALGTADEDRAIAQNPAPVQFAGKLAAVPGSHEGLPQDAGLATR